MKKNFAPVTPFYAYMVSVLDRDFDDANYESDVAHNSDCAWSATLFGGSVRVNQADIHAA